MFKGLPFTLYFILLSFSTVGVSFHVEWCIRHLPCPSIILHNITSITHNQYTNTNFAFPPKSKNQKINWYTDQLINWSTDQLISSYVQVKIKPITDVNPMWNSQNTQSRYQVSIWAPSLSVGWSGASKTRLQLCHYASQGFRNPTKIRGKEEFQYVYYRFIVYRSFRDIGLCYGSC